MKKYEHGEIAEIILSTLLVVGVIAVAVTMPNAVQLFKYFLPKNSVDRSRINRSVYRLERGGYIETKGGKSGPYALTQKGREKAMRYAIKQMRIASQRTWDKKWRLIMFDIPEKKVQSRRAINLALKRLGCVQYQKSVFITPFPCSKEIDFVGECFEVREHIRIIVASEVEGTELLKKEFAIK